MRAVFRTHPGLVWACCALLAITWLDVLDLIETVTLLSLPGYGEANQIARLFGLGALIAVKLLVPVALGILLLAVYRAPRLFRLATLVLWLAVVPYAVVVVHNLQLVFTR